MQCPLTTDRAYSWFSPLAPDVRLLPCGSLLIVQIAVENIYQYAFGIAQGTVVLFDMHDIARCASG